MYIICYNSKTNNLLYFIDYEVNYDEHTYLPDDFGYIKDYSYNLTCLTICLIVWQYAALAI